MHVWEAGNVSFIAKIGFYEWESFVLRADCTSHQTGHANVHLYLNFNKGILTQSFVLEMLPKITGKTEACALIITALQNVLTFFLHEVL